MRTYISILVNVNKKMNGDNTVDWFTKEHNEILKYLDDKNDETR